MTLCPGPILPPTHIQEQRPWPRCPGTCISCTGSTSGAAHKNSTSCLSCRWRESRWHTSTPETPRKGLSGSAGKAFEELGRWGGRVRPETPELRHHRVQGTEAGTGRRHPLPTGQSWRVPSSPTPFSVGSPPKFSSTYQSDSHSQCGEGSATLSSSRCWSPLTSLHPQRSLSRSFSQKPPTGFQR